MVRTRVRTFSISTPVKKKSKINYFFHFIEIEIGVRRDEGISRMRDRRAFTTELLYSPAG